MSARSVVAFLLFFLDFCLWSRWTDSDGAGRDGTDEILAFEAC